MLQRAASVHAGSLQVVRKYRSLEVLPGMEEEI
jgi:hypothetical protein